MSIAPTVATDTPADTHRFSGRPLPATSDATTWFTLLIPVAIPSFEPVTVAIPLLVANVPPNTGDFMAVPLSTACASNKRGRCLSSSTLSFSCGRCSNVGGRKVNLLGIDLTSEHAGWLIAKHTEPRLYTRLNVGFVHAKLLLTVERELVHQSLV